MLSRRRVAGGALTMTLLGALLVAVHGPAAQAAVLPAGFAEQIVFSGLTQPTNIEFANDGRIFVAEKGGAIKVFDNLADTTPTVFANFSANVHNQWDRGLLGMALAPNFPTDPFVYVLYTYDAPPGQTAPYWNDNCNSAPGGANGGNCVVQGRLSRIQAGGTEQVLIQDWCQQFPSHSIGDLGFGADGKLYVSSGDGASFSAVDYGQLGSPVNPCGDPANEGGALRSQDVRSAADPTQLDGTILRLEPATGLAAAGNPNIASPDLNTRRIVANGLRNPFRIAMKPGTNEVWAGDVGWNTWEEINRVVNPTAGVTNFGWPCYEGNNKMSSYDNVNLPLCETLYPIGQTNPYYTYNHATDIVAGEGCGTGGDAIGGSAFYPASGAPYPSAYAGALFFSDYSRGCIWAMKPATAGGLPSTSNIEVFVKQAAAPADVEIGPGGEMYYADLGGTVRRIRYSPGNQAPVAVISPSQTTGAAPLTVNFSGTGSTDADPADEGRLTYQWDFTNDGSWDSTSAAPSFTYTTAGVYTAKLRVTDTLGAWGEATVQIQPGNTAPTAFIDTPAASLTWKVGDSISFTGHATDPQQGNLPASALSWELRMQHCETPGNCHTHVLQNWSGIAGGSFVAPDHEYPSYLELAVTATDAQSLTNTVVRRLDPKTVQLTFTTSPAGLQLSVGAFTGATPFTREVIQGSTNTVSAPTPQAGHQFSAWSDGAGQTHVITAPVAATSYTATYTPLPSSPCGGSAAYQCTWANAPFQPAANVLGLSGDDSVAQVSLPFAFPLYGTGYGSAWIDINGLVSFTDPAGSHAVDSVLPNSALPNAALYAFWDDLYADEQSSIRTETLGSAPSRKFVIEWRDVKFYNAPDRVTFSIVLDEDGTVTYHYAGIGATGRELGDQATAGIENAAGTQALTYSHDQAVFANGKAVTFTPVLVPVTNVVSGVVTQSGVGPAAGVTVSLNPGGRFTTTASDGSYSFTRVAAGSYTVAVAGTCVNAASAPVTMDSGTKTVNLTAASRTDSFGYQCSTSVGTFATAANVLPFSGDDVLTSVALPFPVTFYGVSRTQAWIDSNGVVSFADPGGSNPYNSGVPSAGAPNAAVYAFWDDLVVDAEASVRTQTVGAAPNRKFIIEWRNVYLFNHGFGSRINASVVIGEDNSVTVHYSGIDANSPEQGSEATTGVEHGNGTSALQFSSDQVALSNGLTIRYWKP
ncbi:PQQ-dependent sugar dehydrogenase [Catelliglobosispora koreensis]|uniref:PQQ-dependent sugar dehydrogenase n=1 Tax=Catelliglobosispora koreensis TaxID=129052 RepID=UPI00035EDF73|nr:PQQ-dependent sugar dehydrogenase [Catelliglobosispora koreensis]